MVKKIKHNKTVKLNGGSTFKLRTKRFLKKAGRAAARPFSFTRVGSIRAASPWRNGKSPLALPANDAKLLRKNEARDAAKKSLGARRARMNTIKRNRDKKSKSKISKRRVNPNSEETKDEETKDEEGEQDLHLEKQVKDIIHKAYEETINAVEEAFYPYRQ